MICKTLSECPVYTPTCKLIVASQILTFPPVESEAMSMSLGGYVTDQKGVFILGPIIRRCGQQCQRWAATVSLRCSRVMRLHCIELRTIDLWFNDIIRLTWTVTLTALRKFDEKAAPLTPFASWWGVLVNTTPLIWTEFKMELKHLSAWALALRSAFNSISVPAEETSWN